MPGVLFNPFQIILDDNLSETETKEKVIQYDEEHKTDTSVVMAIAAATKAEIDYDSAEKEGATMQTVFNQIANENMDKGKAEGKAEGIIQILKKLKKSDDEIISELMSTLNISRNAAMEHLDNYNKNFL